MSYDQKMIPLKYVIVSFLIFVLFENVKSQVNDDLYTIYLVRHAEKEKSPSGSNDPQLTKCGHERAQTFATFFKDIELEAVYSSDYVRTMDTASPTASQKGLDVLIYDPRRLEDMANRLMDNEQDALVVGHSNTTGVLAGMLVNEQISPFDESIYNRIYQVVLHKDNGRIHVMHTSFTCPL